MEKENAELKEMRRKYEENQNADRIYAKWMDEASAVKGIYPSFDFETEAKNKPFADLLRSGIDVRTAYEVVHKDDIIHGAMQFAVQQTSQKLSNNIRAAGVRPTENGTASQSAALTKSDVSKLSKADRDEIIRRVQRGEKIRFGRT